MCVGGGSAKRAAAQQRADEEARQARIAQGRQSIDDTFNSTYNDDFFNNIGKTYTDYYNPQVDQQYEDTKKKLTFNLGRQGILGSTEAGDQFKKLEDKYGQERQNIANNALQAGQTARGNVEQQRNQLYSINNSTADPAAAAASAQNALKNITTQPSLTSLGNLFAEFLNNASAPAASVAAAQNTSLPGFNFSNTGGNAVRVVN